MDVQREVLGVLDEVLSLNGRASKFNRDTQLLGAIPELDSMAVVSLIAGLEERFAMAVDDDDIDGDIFMTVGTLVDFVGGKIAA
jgi:acyl carrier protein